MTKRTVFLWLLVVPSLVLGQACGPAYTSDPAASATGTFFPQPSSIAGETNKLTAATTLILWSTKNGAATTVGDTLRPKALGTVVGTNDVLFAFPVTSDFLDVERGVDYVYTVSFSARQNAKNTVITATKAPSNYSEISLGFGPNSLFGDVTSNQGHWNAFQAIKKTFNMTKTSSTPSGSSVNNFYTFTTKSTAWNDYSLTFTPSARCSNCSLVIRFSAGATNTVNWPGNTYAVDNVILTRAPITSFPARTRTDGTHERAILRYPAPVAVAPRTQCPFLDPSVKLWHNATTWGAAGVPKSGAVTIPENTKVLIKGCSLAAATGPFAITIPKTSSLIFDDADIEIHITQIFVYGSLQIGSETCRLWGRVKIVFHGVRADVLAGQPMRSPSYKLPSKGIVAIGGTIDMHGKLFDRTWTRLAFTAYAGEDRITLQHPVNWVVGMDVAVLTSTYIDKPTDHKNDVMRILALSADKTTVVFTSKLQFDHYAGPEYQVEAGLLNRTITLTSVDSESAADKYGGHVLVTQNGVGRFSGVETYKMGQQNVMGRYPLHFHMLDNTDVDGSSAIVVDAPGPAVTVTGSATVYNTTETNRFQVAGTQYIRVWRNLKSVPTVVTYPFGTVTPGQYRVYVSYLRDPTAPTSVPVNVTIGAKTANFTVDHTQKDPSDTRKKWQLVGTITVPAGGAPVTVKISNEGTLQNQAVSFDAVQIARVNPNRSYVRDSSTRDSYWRCVTIHGTNGVKLSRNFAYNIQGSCYYLEDGVEERNIIEYNAAAHVHPIGTPAAGDGQFGNDFFQSDSLQNPADAAASGFYLSNARNWVYGNAASGGWVGYGFPNLLKPIGMYDGENYPTMNPWNRKELSFDGNTAHSAGFYWGSGSCLYVASNLTTQADGSLVYNSGRISRATYDNFGVQTGLRFSNTIFSLCNRAMQHWGQNVEVVNYESHDNAQGARLFGDCLVNNTLFNAHSGNDYAAKKLRWMQYDGIDYNRIGFQFYDISVRTILLGVTFRNFWLGDQILIPMYHMDAMKPQVISAVKNIRYENVASSSMVFAFRANKDTGAAYNYNVADFDGSTFLQPGPVIAGGFIDWWYLGAGCRNQWNVWICDWTGDRGAASLEYFVPDVSRSDADLAAAKYYMGTSQIGFVCQQEVTNTPKSQLYLSPNRCAPVTGNPIITGHGNRIWNFRLMGAGAGIAPSGEKVALGASAKMFIIRGVDILLGRFIITSFKYPKGTNFTINIRFNWESNTVLPVPRATKLSEVLTPTETQLPFSQWTCPGAAGTLCQTGATGPIWFYDDATELLYIRIVNPSFYRKTTLPPNQGLFTWGGAYIPKVEGNAYFKIETTCSPLCTGVNLCANGDNWLSLNTTLNQNRVVSQSIVTAPVLDRFCNGTIPMNLKVGPAPVAPPPNAPAPTPLPPITNSVPGLILTKATFDPVVTNIEVEDDEAATSTDKEVLILAAAKRADSNELDQEDQAVREIRIEEGRAVIASIRATEIINKAKAEIAAAKKTSKELSQRKRSLQAVSRKKSASAKDKAKANEKIAKIDAKLIAARATIEAARATIKSSETEYKEAKAGIKDAASHLQRAQAKEKKLEAKRLNLQKEITAEKKAVAPKKEKSETDLEEKVAVMTEDSDSDLAADDAADADDDDESDEDDVEDEDAYDVDDADDEESELEELFDAEI